MKREELDAIYWQACDTKGFKGTEGAMRTWRSVLIFLEKRDVEEALIEWFTSSKEFPMPSDLRHIACRLANARKVKSEHREGWCWECKVCGFTMSGFLEPGSQTRRFCPSFYSPIGTSHVLPKGTICGADLVATPWPHSDEAA